MEADAVTVFVDTVGAEHTHSLKGRRAQLRVLFPLYVFSPWDGFAFSRLRAATCFASNSRRCWTAWHLSARVFGL
jgi:hypothetical protein